MRNDVFVFLAALCAIALHAGTAMAGGPFVAIPEPATLALVAGGIGALAVVKFRRRK